MLELRDITKDYKIGNEKYKALKGISLKLRSVEFVSILGESGSGKTTLLNIIGGLDRYTSGELIINGQPTIKFKDRDWDSYRNNSIGFVFQSYNLIEHISVLDNVELAMTLSGVDSKERLARAKEVLSRVGLKEHVNKKPSELSGGQKQRVAIARAIVNNPDIILADEPTGALDSKTSEEIMELIKEIAKDKLVIMVTHNNKLAEKYATRIIRLKDGELIEDTNKVIKEKEKEGYRATSTLMGYGAALKLSFNNLRTKKVRTLITAIAGSIGIIGVALVLAISNGFTLKIEEFEKEALIDLPLMISETEAAIFGDIVMPSSRKEQNDLLSEDKIHPYEEEGNEWIHTNKLTQEYIDYINKLDSDLYKQINYTRAVNMNLLIEKDEEIINIEPLNIGWRQLPGEIGELNTEKYELIAGVVPNESNQVLLGLDESNRIDSKILEILGLDTEGEIEFEEVLGKELVLVDNDDFYERYSDVFMMTFDLEEAYENGITLSIVGIIKAKSEAYPGNSYEGVLYYSDLTEEYLERNKESEIAKTQEEVEYNVLTGQPLGMIDGEKELILKYFGRDDVPILIQIYTEDFESKEKVKEYLDKYNSGLAKEDEIEYNDLAESMTNVMGEMIEMIAVILIAFASISLVVSTIMIGIITYVSVLERTREIGVLRALGARKKDISRVFNAEAIIIGFVAGVIGIGATYILSGPINKILENQVEGMENIVQLKPISGVILILISVILTYIAGLIPAKVAAKKDPVEALRSE